MSRKAASLPKPDTGQKTKPPPAPEQKQGPPPFSLWGQQPTYSILESQIKDPYHLFITGSAGCGKTTLIYDFLQLYYYTNRETQKRTHESILWLSSEKDRGIHTIREKVNDFCKRSPSSPGQIRWIIFDDSDSLPLISQQALRRPMETYSHLTKFIFAGRSVSSLIAPLRSRCLLLELEPISIYDSIPKIFNQYNMETLADKETFYQWFYKNCHSTHKAIPVVKFLSACVAENYTQEKILDSLDRFIFSSEPLAIDLIKTLVKNDIKESITILSTFFFKGFLLDDILLALERSLLFYPTLSPERRFLVLKFIMRGWISIQQGKEYWMDTLDVLYECLDTSKVINAPIQ